MSFFNAYRRGLTAFIIYDRNGHAKGYLWASSSFAANNRAQRLAGQGASVEYAA
jgi:hypothetical protein